MEKEFNYCNTSNEVDVNLPTLMIKPQSPLKEPSQENPFTTYSNHDSLKSHSLPLGDYYDTNVGQALIPPQSVNQTKLTQPSFPCLLINPHVASVLHAQTPPHLKSHGFHSKYMLETILHQQEIQKLLNEKKLLQTQEVQSNTVQPLKVDSTAMENTCSRKENSNSKTAFSKSVKESSLDCETKDVQAIKYKMSKAKERCMAYFCSLHSHLL
nr:hypothetical protein [Tanacetum cinerariifolium]